MTLYRLFQTISVFLYVLRIAILVHWFLRLFNANNSVTRWLDGFVEPFLRPFRGLAVALMRRTSLPLDLTYVFALLGLSIVDRLWWLLYSFFRSMR